VLVEMGHAMVELQRLEAEMGRLRAIVRNTLPKI
jgi:hypothetical protein